MWNVLHTRATTLGHSAMLYTTPYLNETGILHCLVLILHLYKLLKSCNQCTGLDHALEANI